MSTANGSSVHVSGTPRWTSWPCLRAISALRFGLAPVQKEADEEAGQEKLDRRGEAAALVPAMEAVAREELPPARPREAQNMLEVGRRGGERAAHGRIERSAHRGEEHYPRDT